VTATVGAVPIDESVKGRLPRTGDAAKGTGMGLMMARVGHSLSAPGIKLGASVLGVAGTVTALTVATQYGLNQDFTKAAPPSGEMMGWGLALGGIGSAIGGGMALWAESASSKAFGRGMLAVVAGTTGAMLVGAPVVRRMLAD
jgi:hypothetical protein